MTRIVHFADAHIDMAGYGRHDPQSGLPLRVMDFLKALDTIVDTAIYERADLVLFAGDAYKDRTPSPTYQREWGRRLLRLSQAGIPTLLLVGNHDLSPAAGRAHAMQEFDTLQVPNVRVIDQPAFLRPADLGGIALQVLALPWITRSGLVSALELAPGEMGRAFEKGGEVLTELLRRWMDALDLALPTVFTTHASIEGAKYGGERTVMLGNDLTLPRSLVCDPRIDYTALGHIHKAQDLNDGSHPPVVYPGSIERVDFGEAADDKFFVVADVQKGKTRVEWRKLEGRCFIDRSVHLEENEGDVMGRIRAALPAEADVVGSILRLVVEYPRSLETQIDEQALRRWAEDALEFHFVRRPSMENRMRLAAEEGVAALPPAELLERYWKMLNLPPEEGAQLQKLAQEILGEGGGGPFS